jgi:hypothetical protein
MTGQRNNDQQKNEGQIDVSRNQNNSLQDPGASVADYGKADQGLENSAGRQEDSRSGNSSIPMKEEDTLGIP